MLPTLSGCKAEYHSFKQGDFGDLERVELEGNKKGATVDFWSSGWLGVHLYDYAKDSELLNILLEPEQNLEKEKAFFELQSFFSIE